MNSKILTYFVTISVTTIIQALLMDYLRIGGIVPNLFLMLTVSTALLRGASEGACMGLIFGIMFDILLGKYFGVNALAFMYYGLIIGHITKKLYKESILTAMFFSGVTSLIHSVVLFLVFIYFTSASSVLHSLIRISISEMVYNLVVIIFIHGLMSKMNSSFSEYTKYIRKY